MLPKWATVLKSSHIWRGKTLNPTFVDYLMPTINMLPRIESVLVHGYPGAGPCGAKGAGEIGCVPPMAAIAPSSFFALDGSIYNPIEE